MLCSAQCRARYFVHEFDSATHCQKLFRGSLNEIGMGFKQSEAENNFFESLFHLSGTKKNSSPSSNYLFRSKNNFCEGGKISNLPWELGYWGQKSFKLTADD